MGTGKVRAESVELVHRGQESLTLSATLDVLEVDYRAGIEGGSSARGWT
jgi:hypothetical protein